MRHFPTLSLAMLWVLLPAAAVAQPAIVPTQLTGTTSEWTTFDAQMKPTGRVTSQVTRLKANDVLTEATQRQRVFDAAGQQVLQYEQTAKVPRTGQVWMDARALVNPQLLRALQLGNLQKTVDSLAGFPMAGARIGDLLPDARITFVDAAGPTPRSVDIAAGGRLVTERQSVTTPAGTFTCLRMTQHVRIETFVNGQQSRFNLRVVNWYAPETGLIRQETYAGDKLFDVMVLNRILPGTLDGTPVTAER